MMLLTLAAISASAGVLPEPVATEPEPVPPAAVSPAPVVIEREPAPNPAEIVSPITGRPMVVHQDRVTFWRCELPNGSVYEGHVAPGDPTIPCVEVQWS